MHQYPEDLTEHVLGIWPTDAPQRPSQAALDEVLSTCYQASMLREETRGITFRLLLGDPHRLPEGHGPPTGLHRLLFEQPRSLTPDDLRRLSPAVEFHRSMIGVGSNATGAGAWIWGIAHSGPRWAQALQGGRTPAAPLPPWPIVHVRGPGELTVYCGDRALGSLRNGRVERDDLDVFRSAWLPHHFRDVREEALAEHLRERSEAGESWAELDPGFIRELAQHVLRRVISVMRAERHGGTVLFASPQCIDRFSPPDPLVRIKYPFDDADPRRRFRRVMVDSMNALAVEGHRAGILGPVGWSHYVLSRNPTITDLDEAMFEIGHLFAALASVDGALVLTRRFEVLGFGAEIAGTIPYVEHVQRALDTEGERTETIPAEDFGTRHRSVFRLCAAQPDILAVVVSQDGQVRFVRSVNDAVTLYDHKVLGAL